MDFDYSDYEYSEAFEEQMEEYPTHSLADEDDLSHDISFKGHIDDIYDPEIKNAHDHLVDHTEDLLHAKTVDEAQTLMLRTKIADIGHGCPMDPDLTPKEREDH